MRMRASYGLLATLVLLVAPGAGAIAFCEKFPDAPICQIDDPPDPCEVDPASCEPEPEPEPESEPEPQPEPPVFSDRANLTGSALVKGEGFKDRSDYSMSIVFNGEAFVLRNVCDAMIGVLVPKGKKGNKFQLFFDDVSKTTFAEFVFAEARRVATGGARRKLAVLAESSTFLLKLREDGTAALKIKSQVVPAPETEVLFKGNLTGSVEPLALERSTDEHPRACFAAAGAVE
jgi:hypothetical protein